jgi:hypothetical protein
MGHKSGSFVNSSCSNGGAYPTTFQIINHHSLGFFSLTGHVFPILCQLQRYLPPTFSQCHIGSTFYWSERLLSTQKFCPWRKKRKKGKKEKKREKKQRKKGKKKPNMDFWVQNEIVNKQQAQLKH